MKLPIETVISMLEAEMTEEKCDKLALTVSKFVSEKGGFIGKLCGGIIYGGLDAATPELLFKSLRTLFPAGHTVEVPADAGVAE